jgi:hypothetical protein
VHHPHAFIIGLSTDKSFENVAVAIFHPWWR